STGGQTRLPDRAGGADQRAQARAGRTRDRRAERRVRGLRRGPRDERDPGDGHGARILRRARTHRARRAGGAPRRNPDSSRRRRPVRRGGIPAMERARVIRLLLVDDDPLVRRGLGLILGGERDIEIVGEAADGIEAETATRDLAPDVVLMDVRMPHQDGVTTAEHLLRRPDPPAIIMLTTFHVDDLVLRALAAGVSGYVLKDAAPDKVIAAIRSVSAGEPVMSPTVARQVITAATAGTADDAKRAAARAGLDVLTPRELDVALESSRGASNAEIAARLFVSVATVKATVTRIFLKLETDNRVTIALRVRDAGLV